MFIADGHCDTLTEAADKHTGLVKNVLHWDISRASEHDAFIQVLAIFQDSEKTKPSVSQAEYYIKKAEAVQKQAENFMLAKDAINSLTAFLSIIEFASVITRHSVVTVFCASF